VVAYPHIYLSPHFDDVALSCGGLVHRQTASGEQVLVITIFAGKPDYDNLGPFAQEIHALWGNPPDILETRRAEDLRAMQTLGADYVRLGYLDALYRRERSSGGLLYGDEEALFGPPARSEEHLPQELAEAIVQLVPLDGPQAHDGLRLYAPLALGGHVDHRLTFAAALHLMEAGFEVFFFEDLPYVETVGALEKVLAGLFRGSWQLCPLSEEDMQAKIRAVTCYESQLAAIWRDDVPPEQHIRAYHAGLLCRRRVASGPWPGSGHTLTPGIQSPDGGYAERYWQLG
jgi:LmbE family N-acetylglucosaminyl deacetylase